MSLFVDHVGLNTLISEEITGSTNTRGPIVNRDTSRDLSLGVAISTSDNPSLFATGLTGYPTTGQLGFSFWINLDNDDTNHRYIMYADNASSYANLIFLQGDKIYFYAHDGTSFKSWNFPLTATSLVDTWKHVYISWSGAFSDDPDAYVDSSTLGLATSAGAASGTARLAPDGIRLFDSSAANAAFELQGRLQSFAIFSNNGTPAGVVASSLYNTGIPKNSTPLYSSSMLDFWLLGNEPQFYSKQTEESIGSGTILLSSGGTIGTNLTSSTNEIILKDGLTTDSSVDTLSPNFVGSVSNTNQLVALNTHRNGPYGYSSWKQVRVSENPITRYHNKNSTMTFVTEPGPVMNLGQNGELRIRSRYSALYNYTEPAIAQKSYPLIWNVGRHFKDDDNQLAPEPQKFSIVSSYGNQQIGFANEKVDKLLKFDPDEEQTEYVAISDMYLENGLNKQDSPLTYWEFLQYRETVYPHMKNQFQNENLERPTFESFFRHNRADRTRLYYSSDFPDYASNPFGFSPYNNGVEVSENLSQSTWPLDEHQDFLTRQYSSVTDSVNWTGVGETPGNEENSRNGEGSLMQTISQYSNEMVTRSSALNDPSPSTVITAASRLDWRLAPSPLYMRRISLANSASVSNPSGMEIYGTGSELKLFQGGALWEAGPKRHIKDATGSYISAPRLPFYDTYEDYIEEARRSHKNFSVVPEFRMSTQVEDYRRTNNAIELDMFDVTGGVSGTTNSSDDNFYEIYSNSDFMRNFEVIDDDHKDFTNGKVLSLRCKAVKKFLPYEGFYPAQRTVDLTKQFYDSFKDHIKLKNGLNVEINDFNYGRQLVMTPLFAPGVLFNTIKSGVAVDYPIITGSLDTFLLDTGHYIYNDDFDKRIPFEAIVEPHRYLAGYDITSNEPHPSGNLSASANWDGVGDELYGLMAHNFLAEVPEFFLPDGELTSVVSKKQGDVTLKSGSVYGMRVKMRRSMDKTRGSVYHSASAELPYYPPQDVGSGSYARENFTMYSRPSAFGPPVYGITRWVDTGSDKSIFSFNGENFESSSFSLTATDLYLNSATGQNFSFTPPYYHGEAWCDIVVTASSDKMTISELQAAAEYDFTRFDNTFYQASSSSGIKDVGAADVTYGPQQLSNLDRNAVQLSASLNLRGIGRTRDAIRRSRDQDLVVDTALDEADRWIIQTKFETPMLNFAHVSGSDHLTLPDYGSGSVPRGMWHQHGRIPEENEGVFLEVGPIERNYHIQAKGNTVEAADKLQDLSEALGFAGTSTKIGRIASSKKISECVVAAPFIEREGEKKFFRLALSEEMLQQYKSGDKQPLVTGEPQSQIGRSVLLQLDKMEKFVFPPSFDFLRFPDVEPVAMYAFEFSHTLSQQDLSDIWQNLPPDIGTTMEVSEVAITHPLLQKELLGQGGEEGNQLIDMPERLKWMVFKVKQRAATNYFKKTVIRNPDVNTAVNNSNVTKDEFGDTSPIQYNWPYDFFSLVELVKIDAEVELGNFDKDEINNYIDNLPAWSGVSADMDKIEYLVGGLEDDPIPEVQIPDKAPEGKISSGSRVENQGRRNLLSKEGVFDIPGNVPSKDGQVYVQLKGRFTVEANIDPLASLQSLQGKATSELLQMGIAVLDISNTTEQSFFSWSSKWYNSDPSFQQKKQQAQSGSDSAAALNNQVSTSQFEEEVVRFIKRKYNQYDTKLRSKNRAKAKAFNDMKVKYSSDSRYSNELEIRAYNSINTGGNAGVYLE